MQVEGRKDARSLNFLRIYVNLDTLSERFMDQVARPKRGQVNIKNGYEIKVSGQRTYLELDP